MGCGASRSTHIVQQRQTPKNVFRLPNIPDNMFLAPTPPSTIVDSNEPSRNRNSRRKNTSFIPENVLKKSVHEKSKSDPKQRDYRNTSIPAAVFWIGHSGTAPGDKLSEMYQLVRESYRSYFNEFENIKDVFKSETLKSYDNIFIILTTPDSVQYLSSIHDIHQVRKIYLCFTMSKREIDKYPKISGVCANAGQLRETIRIDINNYLPENDALPFALFSTDNQREQSTKDLDENTAAFISFQYLINILCRLPESDRRCAKIDLIKECKKYCGENDRAQKDIDEFRKTYKPDYALSWYTRESFLYLVLNKTLRQTNDSLRIFDLRFIIKDMIEQLQKWHKPKVITVYRGQRMSINELNSLKSRKGALISINSFLSTSEERSVAERFLETMTSHNVTSVLFIIHTIDAEEVKSFASIKEISQYPEEREVLFALGSVFKINSIVGKDQYTEIDMTMSEEYNEEIKKVIRELTAQVGESNALSTFGGFILDRGEYDNVIRYCRKMERQLPEGHPDKAEIYNNIGSIYIHRGEYDKALRAYLQANSILHALPPEFVNDRIEVVQAMTYCNIGIVYNKQQNFPEATSYYILALQVYRQLGDSNKKELVRLCALIALAMSTHNPKYARYCVEKGRALQEKFNLPTMHSSYAWLLLSDAILYRIRTMTDQTAATEKFENALKAFKDSLPEKHSDMVTVYQIVGDFYRSIRQYKTAEDFYNQSHDVCVKTHDEQMDHPDVTACSERIDDIRDLIERISEEKNEDEIE